MSNSPTFFRRIAPAVLIGTAAVAVVGLFDPVFGSTSDAAPLAAGGASQGTAGATGGQSQGGQSGNTNQGGQSGNANQGGQSQGGQSDTAGGSGGCANAQEIVGDSINTRWGPVQVAATVANGQLCQVYAVDAPHGDGHSANISRQVIPYLDQQATQNGINFDSVSGATYTSEGYRQSLQTIIDQM